MKIKISTSLIIIVYKIFYIMQIIFNIYSCASLKFFYFINLFDFKIL